MARLSDHHNAKVKTAKSYIFLRSARDQTYWNHHHVLCCGYNIWSKSHIMRWGTNHEKERLVQEPKTAAWCLSAPWCKKKSRILISLGNLFWRALCRNINEICTWLCCAFIYYVHSISLWWVLIMYPPISFKVISLACVYWHALSKACEAIMGITANR